MAQPTWAIVHDAGHYSQLALNSHAITAAMVLDSVVTHDNPPVTMDELMEERVEASVDFLLLPRGVAYRRDVTHVSAIAREPECPHHAAVIRRLAQLIGAL